MELTHSFTVPTPVQVTWAHFQDIGALAECFPGAQVTAVGEDADGAPTFEGTCKVKLGPIALVYAGAGSFVERDEAAGRFVVDAKGRDKRGNGTAGAKVTVTMRPDGGATQVDVLTDLAITGKPAQFGRGVMQDVSDKLLGQFVSCLEQRLASGGDGAAGGADGADSAGEVGASDARSGTVMSSTEEDSAVGGTVSYGGEGPPPRTGNPPASRPEPSGFAADGDALDLGATVVPVLLKSYGKQLAAALAALLALVLVVRALRR